MLYKQIDNCIQKIVPISKHLENTVLIVISDHYTCITILPFIQYVESNAENSYSNFVNNFQPAFSDHLQTLHTTFPGVMIAFLKDLKAILLNP